MAPRAPGLVQHMVWGAYADMSVLRETVFMRYLARTALRVSPFLVPAALAGAWLVYPGLTPAFKERNGIP